MVMPTAMQFGKTGVSRHGACLYYDPIWDFCLASFSHRQTLVFG
jgi:hypothetical protein